MVADNLGSIFTGCTFKKQFSKEKYG